MALHVVAFEFTVGVPAGPLNKVGALLLVLFVLYVTVQGSTSALGKLSKTLWPAILAVVAIGGLMVLSDVRVGNRTGTISGEVSIVPKSAAQLSILPNSAPTEPPAGRGADGDEVVDSFSNTHPTDFTNHTHP